MKLQQTFGRSLIEVRTWPFFTDLAVAGFCLAVFFAMMVIPRSRSRSLLSIARSATRSLARKVPL